MPKYAQTLTANSYNPTDVSTRLKEAFDNLGWGTGKVDILGGYRYTATEETNANTTPLVINGADFIENYQGKNILRQNDVGNVGVVAMYLPGVSSFRINYTIVGPAGTNVSWSSNVSSNPGSNTHSFMRAWYLSSEPTNGDFNGLDVQWKSVAIAPASPTAPGSYTTPWVTGDIVGYPTVTFAINSNFRVVINSVEWTVSQNKFAFQSPNLDSPAFELYSRTLAGNHITTMSTLPIRNAKNPMVRVGTTSVKHNASMKTAYVAQAHTDILYNTHPDPSIVGQHKPMSIAEIVAYGGYGVDMVIRAGSNPQFDGFYVNTLQGGAYNGTVWDTVDKASAFPVTVPQYPAVRKSLVSTPLIRTDSFYGNNINEGWDTGNYFMTHLFEVKNTMNLSEIQIFDLYRHYYQSATTYSKNYSLSFVKLKPPVNGKYEVDSIIIPAQNKTTQLNGYQNWNLTSFPANVQLAPGIYAVCTYTNSRRNESYQDNYMGTDMTSVGLPSISRDFRYMTSTPFVNASGPINGTGIRFIRETQATGGTMHWVEVQAFVGATNVALNKPVTGAGSNYGNTVITDGTTNNSSIYSEGASMTVDLGSVQPVDYLKIWHYYADGRTYNSKLEVSADGVSWVNITPAAYAETSAGKVTNIPYPIVYTPVITKPADVAPTQLLGAGNDTDLYLNPIQGQQFTQAMVRLVQTGSATPVSVKTMFGENWYPVGIVSQHHGTVPRLNKHDRWTLYSLGNTNYKHIGLVRFPFGLDQQMISNTEDFWISPQPGSIFNTSVADLGNWSSRQEVEFGKRTSVFSDGRPYRRAWLSSLGGTSLQANNLFVLNGGNVALNTSYVTDDGREYVSVISAVAGDYYGNSDQTISFRLR